MSNRNSGKGPIPDRWLNCPRRSAHLINDKFLAFKTPLSSDFDDQVPESCRFSVDFLFNSAKGMKWKIGLWIDLTNTSRFYDKKEIESHGCKYLKLACRGHGETPDKETTRTFIKVCKSFISQHPLEIIGVHCTHGFNRTGFLIINYLVEADDNSLDAAIAKFSLARPPGIYKSDYIEELYKIFEPDETPPSPPPRPDWCYDDDDDNDDDNDNDNDNNDGDGGDDDDDNDNGYKSSSSGAKRRKTEFKHKNPVFMVGVPGVTPVSDRKKLSHVQKKVQDICKWTTSGFPGSQPVSMDRNNVKLLNQKPYRVSWKADGTRYMMLIQKNGESFFIDRDNSVFQIHNIKFPHVEERNRTLNDTLLDGEMVIDKADGKEYPRYLAYDIIMYDNKNVGKLTFYPERYNIIKKQVMAGRHRAICEGRLKRETEPFSIRLKEFWPVMQADRLLSKKFSEQLGHAPDGLIFQPSKEPYCPGPSIEVLKWKPLSLNSVDFKLKIVMESGEGILSRKVGHLYVGSQSMPFSQIKYKSELKEYDNKIIECKFENGQWVFMRVRTDKSFPNSYNTAMSVCQSIKEPVTTDDLLNFIRDKGFVDDSDLMPPPSKLQIHHHHHHHQQQQQRQ